MNARNRIFGLCLVLWPLGCQRETAPNERTTPRRPRQTQNVNPNQGQWFAMPADDAPVSRSGHSAVLSDLGLLIWGGQGHGSQYYQSGALFDSDERFWRPIGVADAPPARSRHTATWVGSAMLVWGGRENLNGQQQLAAGGWQYNPSEDTWEAMSFADAPGARVDHQALWTGEELVIWGGLGDKPLADGGRYDPLLRSWSSLNREAAPTPRYGHSMVWNGEEVFVWGGVSSPWDNSGHAYQPQSNTWRPLERQSAPEKRFYHTAVIIDPWMIVWGGQTQRDGQLVALGDGARYHLLEDYWQPLSQTEAPDPRIGHTAVVADGYMIIWGGRADRSFRDGAIYDPDHDRWIPMNPPGKVTPRTGHTALWSHGAMHIFGGFNHHGDYPDDQWSYRLPTF